MVNQSSALFHDLVQDLNQSFPHLDFASVCDEWPGMTPAERQATALRTSLLKKFKDATSEDADSVALAKFLACNIACAEWEPRLNTSGDELLCGEFQNELYRTLSANGASAGLSFPEILSRGRTGPGASVGARGTDFYTKLFAGPLTCTSRGLVDAYINYFSSDPTWADAEQRRALEYDDPEIVPGNRLSFVPKNADTSRVTCTEPSLNMFYQLGLGSFFNELNKARFGVDVSSEQFFNRELARKGSTDDSLCTIDLSSASDTVSYKMIKHFFPRDILPWIDLLRSPCCALPDGRVIELDMVSSMGNGFTFPLETLIFTCAVSAVYNILGIKMEHSTCRYVTVNKQVTATDAHLTRPLRQSIHENMVKTFEVVKLGNFGVFGDDIIVVKEAYHKVVRLLNLLGFEVNVEKSFYEGPFRESCGADYFDGHPVRGVYIKTLKTPASRYVAINRLNEWSAVTGIPLPRTIARLMKSVRFLPIPFHEQDDAGVKVPIALAKSSKSVQRQNSLWTYRRWVSKPVTMTIAESIIRTPRGVKGRIYNPSALLLAFLRGDIDNSTITIRSDSVPYCTKQAQTPSWDFVPTVGKQFPVDRRQLVAAICFNLAEADPQGA